MGGVLKLTLTKRGPLKVTTEAQKKKPDPSQTIVKTAYDPTKEKEPLQGSKSIKGKTTYIERENFENQRIKYREAPNDKKDGSFTEGEGPVRQNKPGGYGGPDGNGGPYKGRKPPRKGEGPPNGFRKTAAEDTDPTHIIRFLGMMTNSEIARKITQKEIPAGMTLGQAFTRAIELEAGYQLSEGVSLARPTEIMQVQEVEEVDEIGLGQKRSKDVVCWQCGEKGHLQCDCPHKETDNQVEGIDHPNAYAGRSEQIIRINQPITVATRDNIYKQMGSQRTKANIYKAGYRKTKAALQEQQKINAAITSTLAAQKATQAPPMQPAVAQTPVAQQPPVQASSQPAQIIQIPATPGPSAPVSVQSPQVNVRYIKLPPGVTKGTYNLRSTSPNNSRVAKVSTTSPAATVSVTRGRTNLQNNQIKQEPATPGMPNTSTTTMV